MFTTGQPVAPWHLSVDGTLLCTPDVWGNRFPPPECWVYLHTTDPSYNIRHKTSVIAGVLSDPLGAFHIAMPNHPRILPQDTYFIEVTNNATGQVYKQKLSSIAWHTMAHVGNASHIDLKDLQVPWTPIVPLIARVSGREFKYPADVARSLSQQFKASNTRTHAELILSVAGQPDPDADLDALLAAIETEGRRSGPPDKCLKFLKEVARSLRISMMRIRKPLDVVTLGLEMCGNTRFNTETTKDFFAFRLDTAVKNAFGIRSPFFLGLKGRAGFSLALFAVGCVARGQKISVGAVENGTEHITSVSV